MLSYMDWNGRKIHSENVCFVDIDENFWNEQTGRRRQLSAAELFPVPGTDDISPAKMGVGGLVPVVPKGSAIAPVVPEDPATTPTPEPESAPTSRRRLHDASKCLEVCSSLDCVRTIQVSTD